MFLRGLICWCLGETWACVPLSVRGGNNMDDRQILVRQSALNYSTTYVQVSLQWHGAVTTGIYRLSANLSG